MKVLLVFGTRPEAIKMAPLIKELEMNSSLFDVEICVTGQHREMLDQVLKIFDIFPNYDLNIMKQGQDLFDVTSNVIIGMRNVLKESKPDILLVHGDTTTSTSAALAAFYMQIPVGHVEAGLRTNNYYSPWPEEMNRSLTGRIASYHFAPTFQAKENLLKENIKSDKIIVTGNTVIDALYLVLDRIKTDSELKFKILEQLQANKLSINRINSWVDGNRKLVLITGHRRENFGAGFLNICRAIKELSEKFSDVDFVYPVHLNPNVKKPVAEILDDISLTNVFLIKPLDYLPFVYLMEKSYLILTDSGGIQEEAPGLEKPVLVMRNTTERPEVVKAGSVKLVGTDENKIISAVAQLLTDNAIYSSMSKAVKVYGDGNSSKLIVEFLAKELNVIKEG